MPALNHSRNHSTRAVLLAVSLFALCLFAAVFLLHLKHALKTGWNLSHVYVRVTRADGKPVPDPVTITTVSPWKTETPLRRTNNLWSVPDEQKRTVVRLRLSLPVGEASGSFCCEAALTDLPGSLQTTNGAKTIHWVPLSLAPEEAVAENGFHSFALEGLSARGSCLSATRECVNWRGDGRFFRSSAMYAATVAGFSWLLLGGVIGPSKKKWCEWLIPLAACCSLLGHCWIVSPRAPMWLDELYTYYGVAHESFADFVQSYQANVNALPPLYFIVAQAVSKLVPLSALPLSLRIFSSLGFGIGLLLTWATLRRHTTFFIASIAALAVCLTSDLLLRHNAEARLYGMYFALVAWIVYNCDRLCVDTPSRRQLVANTLSHALAVSCMYVAGFYSLAVLVSLVLRDRSLGVRRPKVYASVIAGWLPALLCLPLIWAQRQGITWSPAPGPSAVFDPFRPGLNMYVALCGLLALAGIARAGARTKPPAPAVQDAEGLVGGGCLPTHLWVLICAFLALPYLLLAIELAGLPLLRDRYLLPSLIGVGLLVGLVCEGVFGPFLRLAEQSRTVCAGILRSSMKLVCVATLAGLLFYPFQHTRHFRQPYWNPVKGMDVSQTALAISNPLSYFVPYFESGENRNIYWVVRDRKQFERWRRFNPRLNPITMADFVAEHAKFQVIADDKCGLGAWFEQGLRQAGSFDLETAEGSSLDQEGVRVLTVSRKHVSAPVH